jgi:RNA polymerase sigma factor (sigma-70 family)
MKKEISDSQLIEGIKCRNSGCFEYLYKHSHSLVSQYVLKSGGSSDDVKDLIQDCIVITYENIVSGLFLERSGVITYLFSICKNRWNTYLQRRLKRNVPIENYSDLMNLAYEDSAEDEINDRSKYVYELLSKSTDRCKEILVSYYYDSLSMEKIAEKFGYTNADNAKNQKAKCMDKLRKAVKNTNINELS